MLSVRCNHYLETLNRVPQTFSRAQIEDAILKEHAPIFDAVVEFQLKFGGYVQMHGLNRFEWGLIHAIPQPCSDFAPNRVSYEQEDNEHHFTCCNCHDSDHWSIDSSGTLYWCYEPVASSFTHTIERDAVDWELARLFKSRRQIKFHLPLSEVIPNLRKCLRPGVITEASDAYETLFLHQGVYASISEDSCIAFLLEESGTSVLDGIAYSFKD